MPERSRIYARMRPSLGDALAAHPMLRGEVYVFGTDELTFAPQPRGLLVANVPDALWSRDFDVTDSNLVVFEEREGRFVVRTTLHDPPRVTEPGEPQCYGVAWPTATCELYVFVYRAAQQLRPWQPARA